MIAIHDLNKQLSLHSLLQLILLVIAASYFYIWTNNFWSAVAGGMVVIIPAVIFKKIYFSLAPIPINSRFARLNKQTNFTNLASNNKKIKPQAIVRSFYLAEGIKFIATVVLFLVFICFLELNIEAFFLNFVIMQLANWACGFIGCNGGWIK